MKRLIFLLLGLMFFSLFCSAQGDVWLQPNRGQWNNRILYRVALTKGNFFVEQNQFTFALNNQSDLYEAAHHKAVAIPAPKHEYQTIKSQFVGSSWKGKIIESDSSTFYHNYILGKDNTKWKSKVYAYKKVKLVDFYPNIDMIIQTNPAYLKYSFVVPPNSNPNNIKIFFKGMKELSLKDNQIRIDTRFGPIYENGLFVYTVDKQGKRTTVKAEFSLYHDTVSFNFPEGYDHSQTLIIDPNLVFSTFTGSTADNWGFTATPSGNGTLTAGGIVFGVGYPITLGAYDGTYNNGVIGGTSNNFKIDIGISKFSSDGSQLLYSTLLGGTGNETPNSIIANAQGDLYILGVTSSTDFPTTLGAYQTIKHGGTSFTEDAVPFAGTDIIVSELSSDGTQLLASTYLGGSANDGVNESVLKFNYGDAFRGDIIFDASGNILIASSTMSADFPIVNGSGNPIGGSQDGVAVKINPNLTNVIWSTFIGGSMQDAAYSVAVSSSNNVYIAGGTKSLNLTNANGYKASYQGGYSDGYISEINGFTGIITGGTYIGTPHYDQSYFIDIDQDDKVYVFGQSNGSMAITAGVFNTPNSGQFIQQYSSDLSSLNWSTVVGGGNATIEISPTAFMVSDCKEIYYAGWGGVVNKQNSMATLSTTYGFPTTSDAYQSTTNGSNFYIGVLSENAQDLMYGTFMGGVASSYNHVDGGTSRFDKDGSIYHAVCGGCGGNAYGFTTTPNAYSPTNNSFNCNLAAWKFDLSKIQSAASIPDPYICLPDSAFFTNNSVNGDVYFWDFGDGTYSNEFEPHHYYATPGTYTAKLIVSDSSGCVIPDTATMTIQISEYNGSVVQPPHPICPGSGIQLQASGGTHYTWSPANLLSDPNIANPIAYVNQDTTFTVIVSDSCGIDTLSVTVQVYNLNGQTSNDTTICKGDTVELWASGGSTYLWSALDSNEIIGPKNKAHVKVAPQEDSYFVVQENTINGCTLIDSILVNIVPHVPYTTLQDTLAICKGSSASVTVEYQPDASSILWTPNQFINPSSGATVSISTPISQWYYVTLSNICGTNTDSIYAKVTIVYPNAGNDTIVCPGQAVNLWASGGAKYQWQPAGDFSNSKVPNTSVIPKKTTKYYVTVTDTNGCSAIDSVFVELYPKPYVIVNAPNFYGIVGDPIQLSAKGNGNNGQYAWSPTEFLSCVNCTNPITTSTVPIQYIVTYTDENNCVAKAAIKIHFDPLIYVPNTFTPDNRGVNNIFYVTAGNIQSFHLSIFNRWGELIFESHDLKEGWDGKYKGKNCPDGTYVWKIRYKDNEKINHDLVGHVNLLR